MAVSVLERPSRRRAAEQDAAELGRLAKLLERYREIVARAAAAEPLRQLDYLQAEQLLEALWLPLSCWVRDVSAWRESAVIGEHLEIDVAGEPAGARGRSGRLRQAELEVLHPHLFSSLTVAAEFCWQSGKR